MAIALSPDDDYIQFALFDGGNNAIALGGNDNNKPLFKEVMPKLSPTINGVKGPVTLSDMREVSFETLFVILDQFVPSSGTWITKPSGDKYIIGSYTTGNVIDLKKKFGISRKELKDSNLAVADITMIKILEQMCIQAASYTASGAPPLTPITSAARDKILAAISCFALSLNVKEVLDMSQLYALIRPVVEYNITNRHSGNDLSTRVTNMVSNASITAAANSVNLEAEIEAFYAGVGVSKISMYPLLESADGAAARICGALLPCTTESSLGSGVSQTFEITTQDVFYIAALLNMPNLPDFSDITDVGQIPRLINLIRLLQMLKTGPTNLTKNTTQFVIDIVYYFYSRRVTRGAAQDTIMDYLKAKIDAVILHKIHTTLPKWMCDAINSAYFLNLFESAPGAPGAPPTQNKEAKIKYIEQQLVLYLWDSQCHDNKDCLYFRIICVLMFLMKINGPLDTNMFDEMFPTLQLSRDNNLDEKMQFYESAFVVKFSEIGKVNETMFRILFNDQPPFNSNNYKRKKILFYLLSCKSYSDIESLLYVRLSKKSCYLFLQGEQVIPRDDPNQHLQNVFILRNTFGPANQIEQLQIQPEIYINPCLYPLNAILAVDLPIHFSSTLVNLSAITRFDDNNSSKLVVSSATRNDAASQREPLNTYYINGNNILDGNAATAAALAPGSPPVKINMPIFLSRGIGPNNAKAGFIIVSPNVKPNSKDVLFSYPPTNISYTNAFNKKIYLDSILTNFLKSDVIIKKKFSGELFTIMAKKFDQILGDQGGHFPAINNATATQANGYFINGIWSYRSIVSNEPDNYYDNIIRVCIQYDIGKPALLPNNQRPLSVFLEIFRPLLRIVKEKYLAKLNNVNKPSVSGLNLNVIFRTIVDNLNIFFTSQFTGGPVKVLLPALEANDKFSIFNGYLEFILSPWIDERECRIFDNDLNIDYFSLGIMAGGGLYKPPIKPSNKYLTSEERRKILFKRVEESRKTQIEKEEEEREEEEREEEISVATQARQEATRVVTQYLQDPNSTQFNGNSMGDVIGSYGIFLYKDDLITIKTEKQYNAVLSLVNCSEGYNPYYIEPQPVPVEVAAYSGPIMNTGEGSSIDLVSDQYIPPIPPIIQDNGDFVGTPSNKKKRLETVSTPKYATDSSKENKDAAKQRILDLETNKRFLDNTSDINPPLKYNNTSTEIKQNQMTMLDLIKKRNTTTEDNYNQQYVQSVTSSAKQGPNKFIKIGGKRSTLKQKYSKRKPIRRKPIRRKTMKKRIHKRKTRKHRSTR